MYIGALVTMTAKAGSADELRSRLLDAVALTRTEPGNLVAVLMADPEDTNRFNIFEIFRDQTAIEAHRAAPSTKESAPIIHALFGAPMEVKYFDTLNWPEDMSVTYSGEE